MTPQIRLKGHSAIILLWAVLVCMFYLGTARGEETTTYAGLFGYVDGGTIKNIILEDCIFEGAEYSGSIAGKINNGIINNCVISGGSVKGIYSGGIAGSKTTEGGGIEHCLYLAGTVSTTDTDNGKAGAIIGDGDSSGVRLCYYTGDTASAFGGNTQAEEGSKVGKGYTVSLDVNSDNPKLEFVFTDNVKLGSVDVLQSDNDDKLIYGGNVYAGEGVNVTVNAEPKEGYNVSTFTPEAESDGSKYSFSVSDANITIAASVSPINYTITYNLNGGEADNPESYNIETEAFTLNNPGRNGYNFTGWSGTDIDGKVQSLSIPKGSTGSRTYTANFSPINYTITYNLNGGEADNPESYNIESNDITLTNPTKEGFIFTGWTGTGLTDKAMTVIIAKGSTGNRNYTAEYEENSSGETESNDKDTDTPDDTDEPETIDAEYTSSCDIDAAVSIESTDLYVLSGEFFSKNISVDVKFILNDSSYNLYVYSMDIKGLPDWLSCDQELLTSSDVIAETGEYEYHHDFIISGMPLTSHDTKTIIFTAEVKITGTNSYDLTAYGSRDIKITVTSLNPDISSDISIDIRPDTSPDISSDISSDLSIDVSPDISPDISIDSSPDISSDTSSDASPIPYYGQDINIDDPYTPAESESFDSGSDIVSLSEDNKPEDTSPPDIEPDEQTESHDEEPITPDVPGTAPVTPEPENTDNPQSFIDKDTGRLFISLSEIISAMTDDEKQNLKVLKIDSNIIDLSGLEELTSLEHLDLSEAYSLNDINISGNTSIRSINLSGSRVRTLEAEDCYNLEEVNIENCTELEYLDVSNTLINSLNAENCTNLKNLYCSSCRINYLNLNGCISLEELNCSDNSMPKLDAVNLINLRSLDCNNQNIPDWSASRNINMIDLIDGSIFRISAADDDFANIENIKAYDDMGNELDVLYDNGTGEIDFSEIPAKFSYDYVTGFESVLMDVTIHAGEYEGSSNITVHDDNVSGESEGFNSSSNGGCDSGLGVLGLIMILAFLKRR